LFLAVLKEIKKFSWSYPNNQGIGCNTINTADTANLLAFLQELRASPCGEKLIISAASSILPWKDASGKPSADVSGFAKVLDWISVMNYDVWGSWSSAVGPNSPLDDTCAASANQQGSAVSAVAQWTAAGIPKNQIVLGVAGYGHSYTVSPTAAFQANSSSVLAAYPAFDSSKQPEGDKWDDTPGVDECGASQGYGGVFNFWGLVNAGFLTSEGQPAQGISYRFDNCSQTVSFGYFMVKMVNIYLVTSGLRIQRDFPSDGFLR
jgi:chitinase